MSEPKLLKRRSTCTFLSGIRKESTENKKFLHGFQKSLFWMYQGHLNVTAVTNCSGFIILLNFTSKLDYKSSNPFFKLCTSCNESIIFNLVLTGLQVFCYMSFTQPCIISILLTLITLLFSRIFTRNSQIIWWHLASRLSIRVKVFFKRAVERKW